MTQARIRDYEEILILQDKAIEALKQATTVLQQALYVLERARAEHGYQQQVPWNQQYQQAQYWHSQQPYVFYSGDVTAVAGNTQGMPLSPKEYYVSEDNFKY